MVLERVTLKPVGIGIYTPESLLKLLPRFVGTKGLYLALKFPMVGIVLKNGGVLRWMAIDKDSIEFQGDRGVRLFIVPLNAV